MTRTPHHREKLVNTILKIDMEMFHKHNEMVYDSVFFFFQAEDGIRDYKVTGVQTCALPISGLFIREAWAGSRKGRLIGGDPALLSPFEREHFPSLSLPPRTRNGAKVPIVVEMSHPMTPDHQVTSLEVVNETDPIPGKGRFHFTPGNGAIYVAFQARMDEGDSEVTVM